MAPAVLQAIQRTMERAGVQPYRILSNNGGEFSGEFDEWLKEQGIAHTYTQSSAAKRHLRTGEQGYPETNPGSIRAHEFDTVGTASS